MHILLSKNLYSVPVTFSGFASGKLQAEGGGEGGRKPVFRVRIRMFLDPLFLRIRILPSTSKINLIINEMISTVS